MLESLLITNKKVTGNSATSIAKVSIYSHLSGGLWEYNGNYYQYGGKNAAYADDNTFRKWNPTTQLWDTITVNATDGVTNVTQVPIYCMTIGDLVYLTGRFSSGVYRVMIINMTTMQRTTYTYSGGPSHAGWPSTGVAYNEATNTLYLKAALSSAVVSFNISTKAWGTVASGLDANSTAGEGLAYKSGFLYIIGGYTSAYVTSVTRVNVSTGAITYGYDTLGADFTAVWQNPKSLNGIFRYCTWANGLNGVINYVVYDPEAKLQVARKFGTGLGYRNVTLQSYVQGGLLYAGGTTIPMGSANWQTAGRIDGSWKISDPDIILP